MITILKDGVVQRYVRCDVKDIANHCCEGETYVEGVVRIEGRPSVTFELARAQLYRDFEDQMQALSEGSTTAEKDTWTKQEQEARAWLADNTVSTPLLDAMVNTRGVTKEYLVGKIIEKSDAYSSEVGRLLGEKQRLEKELIKQYKEEI